MVERYLGKAVGNGFFGSLQGGDLLVGTLTASLIPENQHKGFSLRLPSDYRLYLEINDAGNVIGIIIRFEEVVL